eukprot:991105-Rhodomonas_salina.2
MALIEAKADVNAQNQHGETPLHFAAMFGRLEILDALIEAGANVHATIERGVHKVTPTPSLLRSFCSSSLDSAADTMWHWG